MSKHIIAARWLLAYNAPELQQSVVTCDAELVKRSAVVDDQAPQADTQVTAKTAAPSSREFAGTQDTDAAMAAEPAVHLRRRHKKRGRGDRRAKLEVAGGSLAEEDCGEEGLAPPT